VGITYRADDQESTFREINNMSTVRKIVLAVLSSFAAVMAASLPATAQQQPGQQAAGFQP
jgi:hypothetical protein